MKKRNKFEMKVSRRKFLKIGFAGGAAMFIPWRFKLPEALAEALPGGMDPTDLPKFVTPMLIPPVMPKAPSGLGKVGPNVDYYEIGVSQFQQQILPPPLPATTVWGYGPARAKGRKSNRITNAPSLTIEAIQGRAVRVKWVNELLDVNGNYLPHLLPVDQTLHWANPPGGIAGRDTRPTFNATPGSYDGPVPLVTHVHGAVGVGDESDGYTEAWYLPDANDIPAGYATEGTWYDFFAAKAAANFGANWGPGYATFQYPNLDRASTNWYHDHALGMTRLNVYAGPAGFFIIRGGPSGDNAVIDTRFGTTAVLPGPAPKENDKFPPKKTYYEIPIAIQDRSFNENGSLFYPDTRAFFDGITGDFIPDGEFSPIWNPEFFGNTMMVNGNTWPFQTVEQRRYRFRFLNGCQSRFLILDFNQIPGVEVWQIGNEGGYLSEAVNHTDPALPSDRKGRILMGLAERADVIVDFTNVQVGNYVLGNVGPDEPFGGGIPVIPPDEPQDGEFAASDPATTGQIMQFRVVPAVAPDPTTPPEFLVLPPVPALLSATVTRKLALIEKMGTSTTPDPENPGEFIEGPVEALLGNVVDGAAVEALWMDPVTESPAVGDTEVWEFYNTTGDAHPMHVHEVAFEVVNRQALQLDDAGEVQEPITTEGPTIPPEPWETGLKDTVTAYPGQVTRIRAQFNTPGQFVWHCHIVEHEDNEMMRPFRIGPVQPGQPGSES